MSAQTERGSGDDCDDEDGCEASGEENGEGTGDSSSGHSPVKKDMAPPPPPPRRPVPPHHVSPPQVAVRGSANTLTAEPSPLTLATLLFLLLSPWEPR